MDHEIGSFLYILFKNRTSGSLSIAELFGFLLNAFFALLGNETESRLEDASAGHSR